MSPLMVLLTRKGYLQHFGTNIAKIVSFAAAYKNMDMVGCNIPEIF